MFLFEARGCAERQKPRARAAGKFRQEFYRKPSQGSHLKKHPFGCFFIGMGPRDRHKLLYAALGRERRSDVFFEARTAGASSDMKNWPVKKQTGVQAVPCMF